MATMEEVLCQGDTGMLLAWLTLAHRRGQFHLTLEWEAGDFDGEHQRLGRGGCHQRIPGAAVRPRR